MLRFLWSVIPARLLRAIVRASLPGSCAVVLWTITTGRCWSIATLLLRAIVPLLVRTITALGLALAALTSLLRRALFATLSVAALTALALTTSLRALFAPAALVATSARATGLTRFAHFGFRLLWPTYHEERMLGHNRDLALDQALDVA